jgi:acetyl esterase/lipase
MTQHEASLFRPLVAAVLAAAGTLSLSSAWAQSAGESTDAEPYVRAHMGVAAIGKTWDAAAFAETVRLYTAVQREVDWAGIRDPDTVSYGADPQQTLRLFRPEQGFSEPGPVIVFVHGNGLAERSDSVPGSEGLMYAHVGKLAAQFGGIGVTANYRTGPSATDRSGAEDLKLVLEWLDENIVPYGGDPDTVVLLANSEGATHAVRYLFDEDAQLATGPGIAAAILSSGLFGDVAPGLGSLIERYRGQRVPIALWSAEYDPARVEIGIAELYAQLCRKYQECPWFEQIRGHNHVSHIMSLGTADTSAQNALIRFYHTVR